MELVRAFVLCLVAAVGGLASVLLVLGFGRMWLLGPWERYHYSRCWFALDRERRAMWWIRLQAIWWHTLLRRPFREDYQANCSIWHGGYWKRGIGLSTERYVRTFPYPFHSSLGPCLLMLASPYIRSRYFRALDPLEHPWRAKTETTARTGGLS